MHTTRRARICGGKNKISLGFSVKFFRNCSNVTDVFSVFGRLFGAAAAARRRLDLPLQPAAGGVAASPPARPAQHHRIPPPPDS